MILHGLLIIAGIALVIWGADRLTEAASAVARSFHIPEIIIGLTIVAAGTSGPRRTPGGEPLDSEERPALCRSCLVVALRALLR